MEDNICLNCHGRNWIVWGGIEWNAKHGAFVEPCELCNKYGKRQPPIKLKQDGKNKVEEIHEKHRCWFKVLQFKYFLIRVFT